MTTLATIGDIYRENERTDVPNRAAFQAEPNSLLLPENIDIPKYHETRRVDTDVQRTFTEALRLSLSFEPDDD